MNNFIKAIFVFLFSAKIFAIEVKCLVENSTLKNDSLVGGVVHVDTENGNMTWLKDSNVLEIISKNTVSRFNANRESCSYGTQKLVSGDELLTIWSDFNSCVHISNNQIGYVSTKFVADMRSKNGSYSEIFATSSGPVPSVDLYLSNCKLNP